MNFSGHTPPAKNNLPKPDFSPLEKLENSINFHTKGSYKKKKLQVPNSPEKKGSKFYTPNKITNLNSTNALTKPSSQVSKKLFFGTEDNQKNNFIESNFSNFMNNNTQKRLNFENTNQNFPFSSNLCCSNYNSQMQVKGNNLNLNLNSVPTSTDYQNNDYHTNTHKKLAYNAYNNLNLNYYDGNSATKQLNFYSQENEISINNEEEKNEENIFSSLSSKNQHHHPKTENDIKDFNLNSRFSLNSPTQFRLKERDDYSNEITSQSGGGGLSGKIFENQYNTNNPNNQFLSNKINFLNSNQKHGNFFSIQEESIEHQISDERIKNMTEKFKNAQMNIDKKFSFSNINLNIEPKGSSNSIFGNNSNNSNSNSFGVGGHQKTSSLFNQGQENQNVLNPSSNQLNYLNYSEAPSTPKSKKTVSIYGDSSSNSNKYSKAKTKRKITDENSLNKYSNQNTTAPQEFLVDSTMKQNLFNSHFSNNNTTSTNVETNTPSSHILFTPTPMTFGNLNGGSSTNNENLFKNSLLLNNNQNPNAPNFSEFKNPQHQYMFNPSQFSQFSQFQNQVNPFQNFNYGNQTNLNPFVTNLDETIFDKRFKVLKTLEEGSFGVVYLCRERNNGNIYAVKQSKKSNNQ